MSASVCGGCVRDVHMRTRPTTWVFAMCTQIPSPFPPRHARSRSPDGMGGSRAVPPGSSPHRARTAPFSDREGHAARTHPTHGLHRAQVATMMLPGPSNSLPMMISLRMARAGYWHYWHGPCPCYCPAPAPTPFSACVCGRGEAADRLLI